MARSRGRSGEIRGAQARSGGALGSSLWRSSGKFGRAPVRSGEKLRSSSGLPHTSSARVPVQLRGSSTGAYESFGEAPRNSGSAPESSGGAPRELRERSGDRRRTSEEAAMCSGGSTHEFTYISQLNGDAENIIIVGGTGRSGEFRGGPARSGGAVASSLRRSSGEA